MKLKWLIFLILLCGIGYAAYFLRLHPEIWNRNELAKSDTTTTLTEKPEKRKGKNQYSNKSNEQPDIKDRFWNVDQYAIKAPAFKGQSPGAIAEYLQKGGKGEEEKARILFTWIAYNIKYDDKSYNTNIDGDMSAEGVLKTRLAVCEGYSELYKNIGGAMGLEVQKIIGYAKGYGYTPGDKFRDTDHAWNAVKINGHCHLLDVTWGSGYADNVKGKLVSHQEFCPYWFDVDKYEFLFRHYPEDIQWALLPKGITLKQFEDMPFTDIGLFQIGFDARKILTQFLSNGLPDIAESFETRHHLIAINFPLAATIAAGDKNIFTIKSPEALDIAFINNSTWAYMNKEDSTYTIELPLKEGQLKVAIKSKSSKGNYSTILKYKVKKVSS